MERHSQLVHVFEDAHGVVQLLVIMHASHHLLGQDTQGKQAPNSVTQMLDSTETGMDTVGNQ